MYPILFEIFGFPISSFGLMLATAFLVGTWVTSLRMAETGLDPEQATTMLLWLMIGGIGGAKLYFAIDVSLREGVPFLQLLLAREGITFYGGLIGATVMGIIGTRVHGIPTVQFANCGAIAVALGQAIGRIGCFLVGDDYGKATDLPWGIAFPQGLPPVHYPVHPTQLYEFAWLSAVSILLWVRRKRSPSLIGEFCVLNGAGRTVIEHWRVNPRVALGLSEAQWIGIGLVAFGIVLWLRARRREAAEEKSSDQPVAASSRT